MPVSDKNPLVSYANPQQTPAQALGNAGLAHKQAKGQLPQLIVVILPEFEDLYAGIKQ
jgi:hypothetical protein